MSGNVIVLQAVRDLKNAKEEDHTYRAQLLSMNKVELLEEMIHFQQERTQAGFLTTPMMTRGKILFQILEESAETRELKLFCRSYRRHLEYELADQLERLKPESR